MGRLAASRSPSCTPCRTSAGKEVVELGCGTAYFGAWLKKAGAARVVGVDPTPAQLETARRCEERSGSGSSSSRRSERTCPLPDASFDLAVSEYGASIWADPYRWIPEAARLLRPGGELVFLRNSTLVILCSPDEDVAAVETLQRPQFGMHRFSWPDQGVEYHLPHGEWIRLLRANGFEILDLIEIQAPAGADDPRALRLRDCRVGAEVAGRGDMASAPAPPLLLASTSPRRREILEQLRIPFDVVAPEYDETEDDPVAHALGKARSVLADADGRPVLGCDTEVVCEGRVYGKPGGPEDAEEMLESLSGRTHEVMSGLALITPMWEEVRHEVTRVTFRGLTPRDLARYVATGEWEGRAGGYAIQGQGAALVERIEGDYLNVVGLPTALLVRLLAERFPGTYGFG